MKYPFLQRPFFHISIIIVLCCLAYSNTLSSPFQFDDRLAIASNPVIKDLNLFVHPSLARDFKGSFEYHGFKNRYIGYLTFALNYRIHGLEAAGYHTVNLFIHIINAVLLYWLVILTFQTPLLRGSSLKDRARQTAFFTALVFACHPIQTQAITYIFQRVTSLATLFYILSLVTYIKWRLSIAGPPVHRNGARKTPLLYLTAFVSAVLAMKTKEIAFTLPVMVTLYELMFFEGPVKRRFVYLIPLLLIMLIIPLTLINIDVPIGELIGEAGKDIRGLGASEMSRWQYLITEFRVIVTYIRLIFLPVNQNLDYDYPGFGSFFDPEVFGSFIFLAALLLSCIVLLCRCRQTAPAVRVISLGVLWFFITLSLESGIIPLNNVISEHRLYLPSIGIFLALITSLFMVMERVKDKWKGAVNVTTGMLAVIILVLTGTTYARNTVWESEVSLWTDVVKKSPDKPRPHNNIGNAYRKANMTGRAEKHFKIALQLDPDYAEAHVNLGYIYFLNGSVDKAIKHYKHALILQPVNPLAHNNLGKAYGSRGAIDKAIEYFKAAIRLKADFPEPHYNLGLAFIQKGYYDKAITHLKTALMLRPDYPEAHNNLGYTYYRKGFIDKAILHYHQALKLNPENIRFHKNLGNAYLMKGLPEKAEEHFRISQRLKKPQPGDPEQ
jgi:tetratricopeptide (TPR) repeat protein